MELGDFSIRLLAEGSTRPERLRLAWGISFLVGDDLLFDAFGRRDIFDLSLKRNDIDPARIRHIVISHDHWDHIAGVETVLAANPEVAVYICPSSPADFKDRLRASAKNIVETFPWQEIRPNVFTTGELAGGYGGRPIYEQALVIKSDRGLAVLTGCSHPGVENIVAKVKERFPGKIDLVIGGFHLLDRSAQEIKGIVEKLLALDVARAVPLHCSGGKAQEIFQAEPRFLP